MSDLNFDGMVISGDVVDTIIAIAARDAEGVAGIVCVGSARLPLPCTKKPAARGIEVVESEDGGLAVTVRIAVLYGYAFPGVAQRVRDSIGEAVHTQIGLDVSSVDVYIDAVQF